MGGGAWWATVHGVAKSQTRLSDFTFTFHFHTLEKEMATHSSVLAWRIHRDRGAWWAAVYGVAQSRTRLTRRSSSSSRRTFTLLRYHHPQPTIELFSSYETKTLHLLDNNFPFPSPYLLETTHSAFYIF